MNAFLLRVLTLALLVLLLILLTIFEKKALGRRKQRLNQSESFRYRFCPTRFGFGQDILWAMLKVADTPGPAQRSRCHPWLAAFFAFGVMMCALVLALLLFPGSPLDSVWRLNPEARLAFRSLGNWSFLLMLTVGTACLFAAIGLWRDTVWSTRLAVAILSVNIIGDLINTLLRHDYRALIGLPIGVAMIFFLVRSGDWPKGFRARRKGE